MAWVACDKGSNERIYFVLPIRDNYTGLWRSDPVRDTDGKDNDIYIPRGYIKKLIGRSLTWNDDPVELK